MEHLNKASEEEDLDYAIAKVRRGNVDNHDVKKDDDEDISLHWRHHRIPSLETSPSPSRLRTNLAIEADEKSYTRKYCEARGRFEKRDVLFEMKSKIGRGQKLYAEDVDFFRDLKENCLDPYEAKLLEEVLRLAEVEVRKTQEEEKELGSRLMKWKEEAKVLKRRLDFLHLFLSYPMKPETEKEIQPCLRSKFSIINKKIRNFEAPKLNRYNARYHYESLEDFSKVIQNLFREFKGDLAKYDFDMAPYLPQDMVENMGGPPAAAIKSSTSKPEPAELIKPSTSTKSENASTPYEDDKLLGAPEVIRKLAINSAVDQISQYFEDKKFGKIGVSGSGWEEVVKALEDLPRIRNTFDIVQSFSLSQHQTIRRLIAQTNRPSKISTSPSRSTRLLLLVDCTDQEMDLHDLLDVVNYGKCFVLKTQSLHVNAMLAVDLQIRMEDHLIPWNLFCKNVGTVLDHSPTLQQKAVRLVEECHCHLLAIILLARALKNVSDADVWELALYELMWQASTQVQGMNVVMINVLRFIWERMGTIAKNCVKYCLLHEGKRIFRFSMIEHAITNGWIETGDEGEHILEELTTSFLLEEVDQGILRMREETRVVLLNIFIPGKDPAFLKQGDQGLTKTPKAKEWVAKEIHLMNNKLSVLPESPNCPFLVKLLLQGNHDLMVIPPSFFECMPVLQVLDLSYTNIKSLPKSISKLLALRQFFLKGCDLLMELPPEIGKLTNLEVFDLQGTEIMYLPEEIGKLVKLTKLWVFFNECADLCKENKDVNTIIPKMALSNLSRLSELSIDVNPYGDWWDLELRAIIHELRSLKCLTALKLYLPVVELLKELRWDNTSLMYPTLKRFQFIVGCNKQRFISRLPHEVKEEFNNFEKGLKYINGEGTEVPIEITKLLKHANAFFLERHWTVKNLSEFGLENMEKLKFCCIVECNEFQTIIDAEQFYQGDCEEDEGGDEFEYDSAFDEENVLGAEDEGDEFEDTVLGSLQYLSIHCMKNMESIWKGPVSKDSFYRLKSLALHTCPKLTTIFTLDMLGNLRNLKDLIVEDCPKINSLVSLKCSGLKLDKLLSSLKKNSKEFLPSLKNISLLELPELVSISNGLCIAPKLESMVIFYCPKLKILSSMEVSKQELKVIKGENEWWDALEWHKPNSSSDYQDYLATFIPLRRDGDLMAQLTKDGINSNLQGN